MSQKTIELFLDDKQLDIADQRSLRLAFSYVIADISKIDGRNSGFSKTITLPATKNNREIFGFTENINSIEGLNQTIRPNARIDVNGQTIIVGVLKITEVIRKGKENIIQYKISLLGDNGSWKTAIKDLSLRVLDYSDQEHAWDAATQLTSEVVAPERNYVYPVASYGGFDHSIKLNIKDLVFAGTPGKVFVTFTGNPFLGFIGVGQSFRISGSIKTINSGSFTVLVVIGNTVTIDNPDFLNTSFNEINTPAIGKVYRQGSVQFTQRFPAINIADLLVRIFRESNFEIESKFFDSAFFKGLYIPFTQGNFRQAEGFKESLQFRAGMSVNQVFPVFGPTIIKFDDDVNGEFFDTGNNFDPAVFKYTVAKTSKQKFRVELTAKHSPGSLSFIRLRRNGGTIQVKSVTLTIFETSTVIETQFIDINAGDEISCTIQPINTGTVTVIASLTKFSNIVLDDVVEGAIVPLAANLPDESQIKMVQAVKHLFNLYFATDPESKTCFIEPRDDFFSGEIIDWSEKIDLLKDITHKFIGDDLAREIDLGYRDDSGDDILRLFKEREGIEFGTQRIALSNEFTNTDRKKLSNPLFAPTAMGAHYAAGFNTTFIPRFWQKYSWYPDFKTEFVPRILFYDGVKPMNNGDTWIFDNAIRTDFPHIYSFDSIEDNDSNLLFTDTLRANGLFERFYKNTFEEINNSRMLIAWFNLNEADIALLNFQDTIFIEYDGTGAFYRLNKIENFDPIGRRTTLCELIKVVDTVEPATVKKIAEGAPSQLPGEGELGFEFSPENVPSPQNFLTPAASDLSYDVNGNLYNKNAGNEALADETLMVGQNLKASGNNQIVMGKNNVEDFTAQFILAGGTPDNLKNLILIDDQGNFEAGGKQLYREVDGVTVPVVFTDTNGFTQLMKTNQ